MALHGMRQWNGQGQMVMDISDRLTQYLGETTVSGNGSFYVPEAADGKEIWCFVSEVANVFNTRTAAPRVLVNQDTNVIYWESLANNVNVFDRAVNVVWGVY